MRYTFLELMWLFASVSFLGWLAETAYAAIRRKRLVNRGLINGPFCIIYGLAVTVNALTLPEKTHFAAKLCQNKRNIKKIVMEKKCRICFFMIK